MTQETSDQIKALGFFCTLLVVPIHCTSVTSEWMTGNVAASRWVAALQFVGSDTVARLAVPWFFAVSGFFLALGFDPTRENICHWWWRTVCKRFLSLGVPYLLWNLFYYVFKIVTGKYGFSASHCLEELLGWNFLRGMACGQLWYVRCLFVYALASPVFMALVWYRVVAVLFLAGLCAAWVLGLPLPTQYVQPLDYSYLLYFSTGVFLARHVTTLRPSERAFRLMKAAVTVVFVVSAVSVVAGGVLKDFQFKQVAGKLMILSGLPMLWLWREPLCRVLRPLSWAWGLGFFMYAFHVLAVSVMCRLLVGWPATFYHTAGYGLKIAVAVVSSVAVGWFLSRFARPVFNLLCGGRG